MNIIPGTYVTHAKLPQLGSGEVMYEQDGNVAIRFSTGYRAFRRDLVVPHLVVTSEAPAPAPKKATKKPRKAPVVKVIKKAD